MSRAHPFVESYEVFTMGENTNANLGHSQVGPRPIDDNGNAFFHVCTLANREESP